MKVFCLFAKKYTYNMLAHGIVEDLLSDIRNLVLLLLENHC